MIAVPGVGMNRRTIVLQERKRYSMAERISAEHLRAFCKEVLMKAGVVPTFAEILADTTTEANLRGVDTHGLQRLPLYVKKIEQGLVKNDPAAIRVISQNGGTCLIDGADAPGQVLGVMAMDKAMELARQTGVGVVGVRNSNNFGAAAYYAMKASANDMIGMVMTETGPIMAPFGGREAMLGNNPMAIAIPAGKYPDVVLDMAMSMAAGEKVRKAAKEGKPIPLGWVVNAEGEPTTDPMDYIDRDRKGCLAPFADHKGSGMAVVVGMLAGVLMGPTFGLAVGPVFALDKPAHSGQFYLALRVDNFCTIAEFKERMDRQIRALKGCRPAKGFKEVLVPGEKEHRLREEYLRDGIPLIDAVVKDAKALGARLGVIF